MLSHYLTLLLQKLHFLKVVIARFFIILFRRKKRIELLHLDYDTKHLFKNSYIIINYRFKNALYYSFGKHKTLEKKIKIFNLKNMDKELELVVHGIFFKKEKYELKFKPELQLITDDFKTDIFNLNLKLVEKTIPKLASKEIYCDVKQPRIEIPKIKYNNKKIEIANTTFNQTDFI